MPEHCQDSCGPPWAFGSMNMNHSASASPTNRIAPMDSGQPNCPAMASPPRDMLIGSHPRGLSASPNMTNPICANTAAVTRNHHGKGVGWYVGTIVAEEEFYDALISRLLADANIRPIVHPPRGVEVTTRGSDDHQLLFLVNHTDEEQNVEVPSGRRELLYGNPDFRLADPRWLRRGSNRALRSHPRRQTVPIAVRGKNRPNLTVAKKC